MTTKKRRPEGEGSVYRRKDGRMVGEWTEANGRTRDFTSTTMRKAVREALEERDKGIAYEHENLTVGKDLDRWLEAVRGSVRERPWVRADNTSASQAFGG